MMNEELPNNEYRLIPPAVLAALIRHRDVGGETGGFVTAVLENDLVEALARADSASEAALRPIVIFLYNEMPSASWRSPIKVQNWKAAGGLHGKGLLSEK